MDRCSGFPCFEVRYDKKGAPVDRGEVDALRAGLKAEAPTDVLVMSHGWNNDMAEARELYARLCASLREVLSSGAVPGADARKFLLVAVLWPSKKFADRDLIPGNAASAGEDLDAAALKLELDNVRDAFDAPDGEAKVERASRLVDRLEDDPEAQAEFVEILRELLPRSTGSAETLEEVPEELYTRPADELLEAAGDEMGDARTEPGTGGAASTSGGAAGLGSLFGNVKVGARQLLNLVTYYQMKERAGEIGKGSVSALVRTIAAEAPGVRVHLVGHSFGGRLVAAAADGSDRGAISTLTLLQAAFSHHGFSAARGGFFRRVVEEGKVRGPILITHTPNDRAVGLAYPIASRIGRQRAAALGDRNDPFGGIGRNGAVESDAIEDTALLEARGRYRFQPGKLHNLSADRFVSGHSDVTGREVAYAILSAVATT